MEECFRETVITEGLGDFQIFTRQGPEQHDLIWTEFEWKVGPDDFQRALHPVSFCVAETLALCCIQLNNFHVY